MSSAVRGVPTGAGVHRARRPEETWGFARDLFDCCGITRVADVTGLDVLGVPVWVAVRPLALTLSVSQGKGLTDAAAKVSAAMEAIELWYAEHTPHLEPDPPVAPTAGLDLGYDAMALQRAARSLLTPETPLPWVTASIAGQDTMTLVPRPCVAISSVVSGRWCPPLLRVSSNGLASGNTRTEAALYGLLELIERDCTADLGERDVHHRDYVEPASVTDPGCATLVRRIRDAGVWLEIVDNTRDPALPCFVTYLWSPEDASIYSGSGCHTDPATALLRALTEAAQSRLTVINGTRDDVRAVLYRSHRWDFPAPQTPPERVRTWADTVARLEPPPAADVVELYGRCVEHVSAGTGQPVLEVPLTAPNDPLSVVRVIAPGLRFGSGDECPRPAGPASGASR